MCSGTLPSAPGSGSSSREQERGSGTLQPTFIGHVATTKDALVLFEACLTGYLNRIPRRPNDRERNSLIRSGCVFIYVENESGIKRWTDGVNWSPSRILGNFLVYRELDKPFPPGEKRTIKRRQQRTARPGEPYPPPDSTGESYSPTTSQSTSFSNTRTPTDAERQLIGSLTDSYSFKPNGLVKKTMSVTDRDVTYHLISYYNTDDVKMNLVQRPLQVPALSAIRPRLELTSKRSFRAPLEKVEAADDAREGHQDTYDGYRPTNQQIYPQTSNYSHAAYPQHGQQQGVSAGYAVEPTLSGFIPQMAAPQITSRETYPNYQPWTSSIPPQCRPNSILPPLSSVLLFSSQAQHPGMYSQASLQSQAIIAPSLISLRRPGQVITWETKEDAI